MDGPEALWGRAPASSSPQGQQHPSLSGAFIPIRHKRTCSPPTGRSPGYIRKANSNHGMRLGTPLCPFPAQGRWGLHSAGKGKSLHKDCPVAMRWMHLRPNVNVNSEYLPSSSKYPAEAARGPGACECLGRPLKCASGTPQTLPPSLPPRSVGGVPARDFLPPGAEGGALPAERRGRRLVFPGRRGTALQLPALRRESWHTAPRH